MICGSVGRRFRLWVVVVVFANNGDKKADAVLILDPCRKSMEDSEGFN